MDDDTNFAKFSKEWFVMINSAMIVYSFTLMIHLSNGFVSLRMIRKHSNDILFILCFAQSFFAIVCHLSRVSDYIATSNCTFKSYFNPLIYFVNTSLLFVIFFIRCYTSTNQLRSFLLFMAITLFVGKLSSMVMYLGRVSPSTGMFRECTYSAQPSAFQLVSVVELAINSFLLLWWSGYALYSIIISRQSYRKTLSKNGAGYTMASSIFSLIAHSLMLSQTPAGLNPEVIFQLRSVLHRQIRDGILVPTTPLPISASPITTFNTTNFSDRSRIQIQTMSSHISALKS
ncbi:hypothetical protein K7432_001102 [Basidiobolus ranarum]|uniref:Vomeronasal type-1 receptor n=1 Tax=Basidiobolus ranarum TaxID=34480 RepID=A0ABR2WA56_9FUNG